MRSTRLKTATAAVLSVAIAALLYSVVFVTTPAEASKAPAGANAVVLSEVFDDITTLVPGGWFMQNNSTSVGLTSWFQGNPEVFPSHSGDPTSYIGANFNNTTGSSTISNWLLTPSMTLNNGDVLKFWTTTVAGSQFPDRLEVRLSTNGASTNVGTGPTAVGDFTTLLQSINPDLTIGGYPETWTEITITVSGLEGPTTGRIGFRYFVTLGGPAGDNSNFIGIDDLSYDSVGGSTPTPTPTATATATPTATPTPGGGDEATYCATVGTAIPDNDTTGLNSTITIPDSGAMTQVKLKLVATHSWVGDMKFSLTSPASTSSVVYDRPGVPTSTFGCSGDNLNNTVYDLATPAFETDCTTGVPAFPEENYRGGDPAGNVMTPFTGEDMNGTWTLNVTDNAAGDTGSLTSWCLVVNTGEVPTPTPTPTPPPTPTPSGEVIWANWSGAPTANSIITMDPAAPGTLNVVGPTGIPSTAFINGIEFAGDTPDAALYLTTNTTTGFLYSVNKSTGTATLIGGGGLVGTDTVGDLSWDPAGNRMLAVGTPGVAAGGARLYEVNLTTGALTNLGTVGNMTEGYAVSLAVRSDGVIFAHGIETDAWYTIDRSTLAATQLGPLGWNSNYGQGASFDGEDTLYHAMLTIDAGNQSQLATIDQTTGAATVVGQIGTTVSQLGDIAFEPTEGSTSGSARADFDGDGKTDVSVYRPSEGVWYLNQSTDGFAGAYFGVATDVVAPGDFDGDGKADIAVYRASNDPADYDMWILRSSDGTLAGGPWGVVGDVPVIGDYNGDGKDDVAVYRDSEAMWYISYLGITYDMVQFGVTGDRPVSGDYDGDGKTDVAAFRNADNTWYIRQSSDLSIVSINFGDAGDILVPGDYDGDGKTDIATFRSSEGTWYIRNSSDGSNTITTFGANGDVPAPGDYDGDGKEDIAVYRNGVWWINGSTSGLTVQTFGVASDKPIPAADRP